MRVLALTRTDSRGPSTRYRIEQYASRLAERGIDVQTRPLFGPTWFRILELRSPLLRVPAKALYSLARLAVRIGQLIQSRTGGADLVLVEQQLFPYLPAAIEELLWPRRQPTVLEFDDAIYLTPGHGPKLARLCARATLVIVGNTFLEAFARRTAKTVVVIPTTVDVEQYRAARDGRRAAREEPLRSNTGAGADEVARPFRVGWIGLRYNFPYLQTLAGPLAALASEAPCELRVISSGLPEGGADWGAVSRVPRPWSETTEAAEIAACDVGVMPLPDTDWARGKCGLKLLQYMACGVPVVASPVGVNSEIIRSGENGLLASTPAEWEGALRRLRDDPQLAERLGAAGRATVEARYSLEDGARDVAEAYGFAARRAEEGDT